MQSAPQIQSANPDDLETLVDTLSDAFAEDPVINWLFPREAVYPALFRLILRGSALPRGMVHMEAGSRGAAIWLPPDTPFELAPGRDLLALLLQSALRMGLAPMARLRAQGRLFASQRPPEPHFHLQFIGCRRRDQGAGVGAALLKTGLRACDTRGMPAYLECSNKLNLPLYERHGFVTRAEADLPAGGPTVWFMYRDAR